MHFARIAQGETAERVIVDTGVNQCLHGDKVKMIHGYEFDPSKFSEDEVKAWMTKHGVLEFNFEAAPDEFWVEIFMAGKHTDSGGRTDTYTTDDLDGMVTAFDGGDFKPPLRIGGHDSEISPDRGHVGALKRVGEKLLAKFADMPKIVREAVGKGLFKQVSSGIDFNKKRDGKTLPISLNHVALLGGRIPAVKQLADLQTYFGDDDGSSQQYLFGTNDNKLTFPEEETMSDKTVEILEARIAKLEAKEATFSEESADLKAKNRELTEQAEEAKRDLEKRDETALKGAKERSFAEAKDYCEAKVKDGVMTPAAVTKMLDAVTYDEDGNAVFSFGTVKEFTETGIVKLQTKEQSKDKKSDDKSGDDASAKFTKKVSETMIRDKVSFAEAERQVRFSEPEIAKAYDEALIEEVR